MPCSRKWIRIGEYERQKKIANFGYKPPVVHMKSGNKSEVLNKIKIIDNCKG